MARRRGHRDCRAGRCRGATERAWPTGTETTDGRAATSPTTVLTRNGPPVIRRAVRVLVGVDQVLPSIAKFMFEIGQPYRSSSFVLFAAPEFMLSIDCQPRSAYGFAHEFRAITPL